MTAHSLTAAVPLAPIKTALSNWKSLWDEARTSLPRAVVSEMGFETSADSYWTLLRMVVQKFEGKSGTKGSTEDVVTNGTNTFVNGVIGDDATMPVLNGAGVVSLDVMPLEADCDSQGAHLRRILKR